MATAIEELLNPDDNDLTQEQIIIQTTFAEVDREMDVLDHLSLLISNSIQESSKRSNSH